MKQPLIPALLALLVVSTALGLKAQPPNNNCSGATSMTWTGYGTATYTGTVQNATQSIAPIACEGYTSTNALDIWYSFTAIAYQTAVIAGPTSGLDIVIDVRSGTACNGSNIACADNAGGPGEVESVIVSTTPGNTYYIRLYDYNNNGALPTSYTVYANAAVQNGANMPDLVVQNATLNGTTSVAAGGSIDVDCTVYNDGDAAAGSTSTLQYWLVPSNNITCDPDNTVEQLPPTESVSNLGGNSGGSEGATLDIPASTPPGNYRIMFWVDPDGDVNEYNEINNTFCLPVVVTTAAASAISLSGNLAFGNVQIGNTPTLTLTVTNTGSATLNVSSISYPTGFSGAWSGNITAGSSQNVTVTFSPGSAQSYGGTITVNTNAASGTNTISCSGTGTSAPTAAINLSGNLAFGSVQIGNSSTATLTVTNTGSASLNVTSISYPTGFSGAWSGNITAGSSQNVTVTFSPGSAQSYGGTITVNSNAMSGTNSISCSGTGTSAPTPAISLSGNLAFGSVQIGNSATATLTVTNTGNATLSVASISYPTGFSGAWSGNITAGNSQNITVTFSPGVAQSYAGTVTVNSNAASGTNTISCNGIGTNPTNPTITITYPNGGETWTLGTTYMITATINGNLTGTKSIDVSYDGGAYWNFIGVSSAATTISIAWTPSYIPSTDCRVRVRGVYQGNNISDISDADFTIQNSASGQGFGLSSSSTSHLYWPYSLSEWHDNPLNPARDGWLSGDEGGPGSAQGTGGHLGGDYHAQDWNRTGGDCQSEFYAPLSGTVIFVQPSCTPYCAQNCTLTGAGQCCGNGFGNTVIIRSDIYDEFAFRVSHLYSVTVTSGQVVNAGDLLGTVGMTGRGTGSHAHCTLYKNITSPSPFQGFSGLQRLTIGGSVGLDGGPNTFAANYLFDAVNGGAGGGIAETSFIAASQTFICPGESTTLTAAQGNAFYWSTGDSTQSILVSTPGDYSVIVSDGNGNLTMSQTISVSLVSLVPVQIITPVTAFCEGSSLELNAWTVLPDTTGEFFDDDVNQFSWSSGATAPSITVIDPGTYSVTYTDGWGCASSTDEITITMISAPAQPEIQVNQDTLLASSTVAGCTYQWYLDGIPLPDGLTQFFTAQEAGYYTVAAINASGCSTLSEPEYIDFPTALDGMASTANLNISPNPSTGVFSLHIKGNLGSTIIVDVFGALGQAVHQSTYSSSSGDFRTEIDISSLPSGVYSARITMNGKPIYRKISVIH